MDEQISGSVERVTYYNPENGYSVVRVKPDSRAMLPYRYATGREGDWPAAGFSPRSAATTIYVMDGFDGRDELLAALGPHTTGVSCLYLKRLDDVDLDVLAELVRRSYRDVAGKTVSG